MGEPLLTPDEVIQLLRLDVGHAAIRFPSCP